jgi:hypothetical protein
MQCTCLGYRMSRTPNTTQARFATLSLLTLLRFPDPTHGDGPLSVPGTKRFWCAVSRPTSPVSLLCPGLKLQDCKMEILPL